MDPKIKLIKVSGQEAVELFLKCIFIGLWHIIRISFMRMWKGRRRRSSNKIPPVELIVDPSIGTHCYVKIMNTKYHYVEMGPKSGQKVIILNDATNTAKMWSLNWSIVVSRLAENGHHVITLDLRGTGGSEGGPRRDFAPPKVMEELSTLMQALGVSQRRPAIVIGFGVGGMVTWYLAHCKYNLIRKVVIVGAPHPTLYWEHPPPPFCHKSLHFIQWPYFPEKWLAEGELLSEDDWKGNTRACDWNGVLNYVRGVAWCRIRIDDHIAAPTLLIGGKDGAAQLVISAAHCLQITLRMVEKPSPEDKQVCAMVLDFLIDKKTVEEAPKTLVGRVLGAVAGRGRELTAKLVLPPAQA